MELKELWYIILNRKWIIIQALVVITLTAIGGSLWMTPVYRSTSKVVVEERGLKESLLSSLGLKDLSAILSLNITSQEDIIATQMQLIKTTPNLEEVIQRLQLKNDDGVLFKPKQLQVKIDQIKDTNIIKISADSTDPEKAAQIANTLAHVYLEKNLNENQKTSVEIASYINQQQVKVRNQWLSAIDKQVQYMKEENIVDLDIEKKILLERAASLREEWESNQRQIEEVKTKIAEISKQLNNTAKYQVSSRSTKDNPHIQDLKRQLMELNINIASRRADYTDSHPVIIALQNQIDSVKVQLKNEIRKIFKDESVSVNPYFQKLAQKLGDNHIQMAELTARERILPGVIKEYLLKLTDFPDKKAQLLLLQTELNIQEKALGILLEKAYQTEMATMVQSSNISLVEQALVPKKPVKPNIMLNTAAGMFLGLCFGLGMAFLLEYMDDAIKNIDDIRKFGGVHFFGSIHKWKKKNDALISRSDFRSRIPEAYRIVKNNLMFAAVDKQLKTVLITSAMPDEGKSVTAANLGISFSRDNKKILLLDADLRRSSQHQLFGLSNRIGFTDLIRSRDMPLEDAIQQTTVEGLYLIASGPLPPNPDQYIESLRIGELIKNFSERFDLVIIDTPPIMATNDAVLLSRYADAVIDVLEAERVTKKALSLTMESLAKAKTPILGTILNKFTHDRENYYYNYYRYYSEKKDSNRSAK